MLKKTVLRGKKDFSAIYGKGKSLGSKYVVMFYKKNGLDFNRIGFLSSKKVGNSVVRNRSRRLMRESYRQLAPGLKNGYDIIFIARATMNNKSLKCIEVFKNMRFLVKKAGLNNQ